MIEQLIQMKGKTYSTLALNKRFTVEEVEETGIVIRVHGSGKNRSISRSEIDKAWVFLQQHGTITETQIFDMGTQNPAYIAVFLSNLPGVDYRLKPVRLFIK